MYIYTLPFLFLLWKINLSPINIYTSFQKFTYILSENDSINTITRSNTFLLTYTHLLENTVTIIKNQQTTAMNIHYLRDK